jgi:type IV pilus assembly protein PilE
MEGFGMSSASDARGVRGFTLIELMITIAIIGTLGAIAYPSFMDSVRKSRRSEGISEFTRIQQAQEAWRANNSSYNGSDVSSAATGLRLVPGTTVSNTFNTSSGYYAMSIASSATGYTAAMAARTGTTQVKDTNCQCMRVVWAGGNATYEVATSTTGSCASVTWSTANQQKCWKR